MTQPRGTVVHIANRYDPAMNPRSAHHDPQAADYGSITGRNDNPIPRQEN